MTGASILALAIAGAALLVGGIACIVAAIHVHARRG